MEPPDLIDHPTTEGWYWRRFRKATGHWEVEFISQWDIDNFPNFDHWELAGPLPQPKSRFGARDGS